MKRILMQFTVFDETYGDVPANSQAVLPFHYLFPGKLDRGTNATGYTVWDDDIPKYEAAAKQRGMSVAVL